MKPDKLEFFRTSRPGEPVRLTWRRPRAAVTGYVVFHTRNPFPPEMAPELFAGRMGDFVTEERLDGGAADYSADKADPYYAVLSVGADGAWSPVEDLREAALRSAGRHALDAIEAKQGRTFVRARWAPRPDPDDTAQVDVWVEDMEPEPDELSAMLAGERPPTFQLEPNGDGFIDTVTEPGFRKYYAAVAVGRDGARHPLRLNAGGFVRLDEPVHVASDGAAKVASLMDAVIDQLDMELRRRSLERGEFDDMVSRARDLDPNHPDLDRIEREGRRRFG